MVTSTRWQESSKRSLDSIIFVRDKLITIEAWLFAERRIWLYGSGVVVAYTIGLVARLLSDSWIFQTNGKPSCIDFSHMWVSGTFAGQETQLSFITFRRFLPPWPI